MTDAPAKGPPCCPIGARPDAADIDTALRAGEAMRSIGERVGATYFALQKHRAICLQPGSNHGQPSAITGATAAIQRQPIPLRERAERMFRRVARLLKRAENGDETVDLRACAGIARELRGVLELQAKLDGEIKAASTTVNVFQSQDWKEVRDVIAEALADHPEASEAVLRVIREREQRTLN